MESYYMLLSGEILKVEQNLKMRAIKAFSPSYSYSWINRKVEVAWDMLHDLVALEEGCNRQKCSDMLREYLATLDPFMTRALNRCRRL